MKYLIFTQIFIAVIFFSCDKSSDGPEEPDPKPGTEEPKPEPGPKVPEGMIEAGGIYWDTENILDYCTYQEADQAIRESGKRLATKEEWQELAKYGCTEDKNLIGFWYGKDHNLCEKSKESIFFPSLGYISHGSTTGHPSSLGLGGYYYYAKDGNLEWCHTVTGYDKANGYVLFIRFPARDGAKYSLRLVQDKK